MRTALIVTAYTFAFFGALPALLWAFGVWLDRLLNLPALAASVWSVPGIVLAVAGTTLMLWSMWLLRVDGKGWPISHLPPTHLVQRGPYAWMRHPIYVGYTLAFAGLAMLSGSPGRAVGATVLLTIAWMLYALFLEEPRLHTRLGDASDAYTAATPLLPLIARTPRTFSASTRQPRARRREP